MREISECTAEVFRRSEKRIKERKRKRNRILMYGIPFLICISVFSAALLPSMMPRKSSNFAAEGGVDVVGNTYGTVAAYTCVEVISVGTATQSSVLKDDVGEVVQIYYAVQSFFTGFGGGNKKPDDEISKDDARTEENKDYSQSGTDNAFSGYRIIFIAENGTQTAYYLAEDKLINEATKQEAFLTAEQRSDILNMFGLTDTREENLQ